MLAQVAPIFTNTADLGEAAKDLSSDAATEALNFLSVLGTAGTGAAIGLVVGLVIIGALILVSRRHSYVRLLQRRVNKPILATTILFSAHLALKYQLIDMGKTFNGWLQPIDHGLVVLSILAGTWFFVGAAQALEDITNAHYQGSLHNRGQRLTTQAQILRRTLQAVVIFVGVSAAILTFPSARLAVSSILASATLVSLVFGFAAQSTLGNMFAGLQLAFTDAIRVGDMVNVRGVDGTSLLGVVEEITLTYVVVHRWDERRMIVPSQWFTKEQFENWTRNESDLLGTVELTLDFKAPVHQIRTEVTRLVNQTDLWDGREIGVQVTDMTKDFMTVRVVVSGRDTGNLWDLRCYLREHLIEFIVRNAEYCLPRVRWQQQEIQPVEEDRSPNDVAQLAQELVQIQLGEVAAPGALLNEGELEHEARVLAAKKRSQDARARKNSRKRPKAEAGGEKKTKRRSLLGRIVDPGPIPTEAPAKDVKREVESGPNLPGSDTGTRVYTAEEQLRSRPQD